MWVKSSTLKSLCSEDPKYNSNIRIRNSAISGRKITYHDTESRDKVNTIFVATFKLRWKSTVSHCNKVNGVAQKELARGLNHAAGCWKTTNWFGAICMSGWIAEWKPLYKKLCRRALLSLPDNEPKQSKEMGVVQRELIVTLFQCSKVYHRSQPFVCRQRKKQYASRRLLRYSWYPLTHDVPSIVVKKLADWKGKRGYCLMRVQEEIWPWSM